jgi:hypothetical protein
MEKLTKDISDIIITVVNTTNEKVRGLNFLELLKTNLIEKLLPLFSEQKFPLEQVINYEKEIKENSRNIKISINYFINSISISKKKIDNDSLFLIFNEASNFDIYKDEKNFTSILLYKNTGISLSKDTVINLKYNKNVLLVEIINKDIEQILIK